MAEFYEMIKTRLKLISITNRLRVSAILLALIWSALYLPNLRTSPPWYGDETLIHHTSRNLVVGLPTNFAIWNTFWHPHYPYQPVYTFINGIFAKIASGDIWGSRLFNAILALLCALTILTLGFRLFGWKASLFAATMFLCYEQTIIHFRMSYAHNAAGLGLLIMTLFLTRGAKSSNDWRAGLGLILAAGSHPLFVNGAISAFICRILKPKSWIRIYLPTAIYLFLSFIILYLIFGNWLIEDLNHLKKTYIGRAETDGSGIKGFFNFYNFITQDSFHIIMAIGLLLGILIKKPVPAIIGFIVLYLLVRNRQNLIMFYYQSIVILPVLSLGWAGLWRFLEVFMRRFKICYHNAIIIMAIIPLFIFLKNIPDSINGTFIPRNIFWTTQSSREVEEASQWLNARTTRDDFVAANPNIAWLLNAQTAPYLQIITWYGIPTQGYENGNKRERFRFDISLENARYAVIGDIDSRWTFGEPNLHKLANKLENEKWPIEWQGNHYIILKNPNK